MSRVPRIVAVGEPHHITQPGNNYQDIFFVDEDREMYLEFLRDYSARNRFQIHAYCLMPNHIHIVGVPEKEDSMAKAIGHAHFRYSQYINRRHERSGHLWQGRFQSCTLDGANYGEALRFVEQNPIRAKLVKRAMDYPWSSAGVHCGAEPNDGLLDLRQWQELLSKGRTWKMMLRKATTPEFQEALCLKTRTGRPLCSENFLVALEKTLKRRIRPLPVGRPRGSKAKKTVKARKAKK